MLDSQEGRHNGGMMHAVGEICNQWLEFVTHGRGAKLFKGMATADRGTKVPVADSISELLDSSFAEVQKGHTLRASSRCQQTNHPAEWKADGSEGLQRLKGRLG